MLTAANPAWAAVATQKADELLAHLPDGRQLKGLAPNGPLYFAFMELPGADQTTPSLAIIAKVANYKEFRDGILSEDERKRLTSDPAGFQSVEVDTHTMYFLEKQDFAIMASTKDAIQSMTKSYAGLDTKLSGEFAEQFSGRDVAAYVNMAEVLKAHGDTIRQYRDMFMMVMQTGAGMDEHTPKWRRSSMADFSNSYSIARSWWRAWISVRKGWHIALACESARRRIRTSF